MFIEQRIYNLQPATLGRFLDVVEREELPLLQDAAPHVVGYYHAEVGELNKVVGLWRWDSMEQREVVRRAMVGRFFEAGLDRSLMGMTVGQRNELWHPAPFFDIDKHRLVGSAD